MSTASPSVPAATASQYAASPNHAPPTGHAGSATMHGNPASSISNGSEHVAHSTSGIYADGVASTPHHLAASSFPTQMSPMSASPYAPYGAAQHPLYGGAYSSHAYPQYPGYMGHVGHYAHPPHYLGASASPAYHAPVVNSMMPHSAYPHGAHMSHHQSMPLSIGQSGASATAGPAGAISAGGVMPPTSYNATPQYSTQLPLAGRHRVTTTLWEDEGTLCFQVDAKGVCVARRHDNNMINGTKLLNVCGMSRGKRDGILKNEKERIVVKVGAMHLKGVWIAFNRGKQLAEQHGIADALYPLFEPNIQSFLYHPDNYPRTAAVMAAAQERHVQRHYVHPTASESIKDVDGDTSHSSISMHSGMGGAQWASTPQDTVTETSALPYHYQNHPHYQHHPVATSQQGVVMGSPYGQHTQPMRTAVGHTVERRDEGPSPTRRISGMKRGTEEFEGEQQDESRAREPAVSSDAEGQSNNGSSVAKHAPVDNLNESFSASDFSQSFFDDSLKLKRQKIEETPSISTQGPTEGETNDSRAQPAA